jgi:3'(2'), 5'-bisphosphate nucleotidase
MEYNNLLLPALQAALQASQAILEVYSGTIAVEEKEDHSPLTEADRRAHNIIMATLRQTGLPVLSEESEGISLEERLQWKAYWLVDPLDGTKEFIKRNGEFTVNIALIEGHAPTAGVVMVPVKDWLYLGWPGWGSLKVEQASQRFQEQSHERVLQHALSLPARTPEVYTLVASRSHMSPETQAYLVQQEAKYGKVEVVSVGSSLKINYVAEGWANEYPRFGPTMEWDTAAGQAVAEHAGCVVWGWPNNQPLHYNKEDLHNPFFRVFRRE